MDVTGIVKMAIFMDSMTDRYAIFRKTKEYNILGYKYTRELRKNVLVPKKRQWHEKKIEFAKKCLSLIEDGYTNGAIQKEHVLELLIGEGILPDDYK